MASGLDLGTGSESVAERRNFFEFKTSMTDVRGETAAAADQRRGTRNRSIGRGLNEVGTEFLGLRYLDATYGKDKNASSGAGGMGRCGGPQSQTSQTPTSTCTAAAPATITRNASTQEMAKKTVLPFMGVPTSGDGKPLIELRWVRTHITEYVENMYE